jgi:hypothetical protein
LKSFETFFCVLYSAQLYYKNWIPRHCVIIIYHANGIAESVIRIVSPRSLPTSSLCPYADAFLTKTNFTLKLKMTLTAIDNKDYFICAWSFASAFLGIAVSAWIWRVQSSLAPDHLTYSNIIKFWFLNFSFCGVPRRYAALCEIQGDTKKLELLKTPAKIVEIQQQNFIDRNWTITTCLLRDSNPNYQSMIVCSSRSLFRSAANCTWLPLCISKVPVFVSPFTRINWFCVSPFGMRTIVMAQNMVLYYTDMFGDFTSAISEAFPNNKCRITIVRLSMLTGYDNGNTE